MSAKFRINASRRHDGGAIFDVTWLSGRLYVGDTFRVYEAGHRWPVRVLAVNGEGEKAQLVCDISLGWDDQYSPALVDTDGGQREFIYLHDDV